MLPAKSKAKNYSPEGHSFRGHWRPRAGGGRQREIEETPSVSSQAQRGAMNVQVGSGGGGGKEKNTTVLLTPPLILATQKAEIRFTAWTKKATTYFKNTRAGM
jgi:hypothetical protein